jgi:hypothetical protein
MGGLNSPFDIEASDRFFESVRRESRSRGVSLRFTSILHTSFAVVAEAEVSDGEVERVDGSITSLPEFVNSAKYANDLLQVSKATMSLTYGSLTRGYRR